MPATMITHSHADRGKNHGISSPSGDPLEHLRLLFCFFEQFLLTELGHFFILSQTDSIHIKGGFFNESPFSFFSFRGLPDQNY